jgi:hypothetical protein
MRPAFPRLLDLLLLAGLALIARIGAAIPVDYVPYTDPAYYQLVAGQLAAGHGFSAPVLWSFLEVGGQLPLQPGLPVASNGHWMPLTSILAAGSISALGGVLGAARAAQVPSILLGSALVPFTYLISTELWPSRFGAWVAALLVLLAGPLLVMIPLTDGFAIFGAAGALAIWCAIRATRSGRPGPWLVVSGVAAALGTLARIDGLLLLTAPAAALLVGTPRAWPTRLGWAAATLAAFAAVLAPWLLRDLAVFGSPFPSAGGRTLWITTYNQQFSISGDPSLGTYLGWGPGNIIGSKLFSWIELAGRTVGLLGGIFIVPLVVGLWRERLRRELAPFLAYFAVMFVAMGAVFTFHAPKGAYYHSALAWLPFAAGLAVASMAPTAAWFGRWWPFLRRAATHRFLVVAGLAGATALALLSATVLVNGWSDAHDKLTRAAQFLEGRGAQADRVLSYDPAALYALSGNPGVAPPFDPYDVIGTVVTAYDVRWVVVTLRPGETRDPLGLWDGAAGTDGAGVHPNFLPAQPAFEAPGVRVYEVVQSAASP